MYLYLFYAYYVTYYNVVLKSLFCFFCRGLCPLKPHQGIAPRPNGGTLVTPKPIEIISSLQLPGQSHPCHCRGWIVQFDIYFQINGIINGNVLQTCYIEDRSNNQIFVIGYSFSAILYGPRIFYIFIKHPQSKLLIG